MQLACFKEALSEQSLQPLRSSVVHFITQIKSQPISTNYMNGALCTISIQNKGVNTVPETIPVWPLVRYISDTGQYRYTVSDLSLLYIYIYTHTHKKKN